MSTPTSRSQAGPRLLRRLQTDAPGPGEADEGLALQTVQGGNMKLRFRVGDVAVFAKAAAAAGLLDPPQEDTHETHEQEATCHPIAAGGEG